MHCSVHADSADLRTHGLRLEHYYCVMDGIRGILDMTLHVRIHAHHTHLVSPCSLSKVSFPWSNPQPSNANRHDPPTPRRSVPAAVRLSKALAQLCAARGTNPIMRPNHQHGRLERVNPRPNHAHSFHIRDSRSRIRVSRQISRTLLYRQLIGHLLQPV